MEYVRRRKRIIRDVKIIASLLSVLLLVVIIINIDKFYAKFVYRGNLNGSVVIPSKSKPNNISPNSKHIQTLNKEITITYTVSDGYYNNDINHIENVIKYVDGKIIEGEYLIPTFITGSFRKWYTTPDYKEGTEFDINNYTGEDITVYAYKEETRAKIDLKKLNEILNTNNYNEIVESIEQDFSLPTWLPENIEKIDLTEYNTSDHHIIYLEKNTDDSLPVLYWFTNEDKTLHWYSIDPTPLVIAENIEDDKIGFNNFTSLTNISGLRNWDLRNLTSINYLFNNCNKLKDISSIKYWNTENIISMKNTFSNMTSLEDASSIADWNISNVTDFTNMFQNTGNKPVFTSIEGTFNEEGTFIKSDNQMQS